MGFFDRLLMSPFERTYRDFVTRAYGHVDLRGLTTRGDFTPAIEDVYVEAPLPVAGLLGGAEPVVLAVVGAPGIGKTALLRHLAVTLAAKRTTLPIILTLRNHFADIAARPDVPLPELIGDPWFERRLRGGRCVVMLDGLDEVPSDLRGRVSQWAERQIERYGGNDFIVTSRPHGYMSAPLRRAQVLQLGTFDERRITDFVHRWYRAATEGDTERANEGAVDVLLRLRGRPALYDLAANPLLLTMIVNVHWYRGALPGTRTDLYAEMCQVLLYRRQEAKGLRHFPLPGDALESAMRFLALHMMRERLRDIASDEAVDVLRPVVRRLQRSRDSAASAAQVLRDVHRSGLLVEREPGRYSFVSHSFQEYLASAQIGDVSVLTSSVDDPWWRETTLLWAAHADVTPVIEACLRSGTSHALGLAFECAEVARELSPDVLHVLQNLTRPDIAQSAAGALIGYTADVHGEPGGVELLLRQADTMLDRRREAAADLYLAALCVAEDAQAPRILAHYLHSLSGRLTPSPSHDLATLLRTETRTHGHAFLGLLPPLLAEATPVRDTVLDLLCDDHHLTGPGREYLAAQDRDLRIAWRQAAEAWRSERWWIINDLGQPERLELSAESLTSYEERVLEHRPKLPDYLAAQLDRVRKALASLRAYAEGRSFESRDTALRSARRIVSALEDDVRTAPTALSVEVVLPVARRVADLADEAHRQLVETCPPRPSVSLALPEARVVHGVATVAVEIANAENSAPVESGEFDGQVLPAPVRGGTSQVVLWEIRLPASLGLPATLTSFPTLRYRPRFSEDVGLLHAQLDARLPQPTDFLPIPNPYLQGATGVPVQNAAMFFGRDELIDRVRTRLRDAAAPGAGVAVFGQKRAGKSSVRLHLVERLRTLDGMPVVDLGNIGDLSPATREVTATRLLALLMWRILEGADEVLAKGPPLLPPGLDRAAFLAGDDPVYDCAKLFVRHREAHPGQPPLVVLMDEFQYLETWIRKGLVSPVFMHAFKALVERRLFHLVIVGQSDLDRMIHADPNVFGVFGTERVTYLAEPHARRLVEEPLMLGSGSRFRFRPRAVTDVLALTGCNAFYIQRFCSELVEHLNERHAPYVTEADVEHVRERFLGRLEEKDFDNLESHGGDHASYQPVLLAVARACERHGGAAAPEAVAEQYRGDAPLDGLLRDLVLHDVLRRHDGTYRIVVGIYHDWLLRYFGTSPGAP